MNLPELAAYVQTHLRKNGIDAVLTGGAVVSHYSRGLYVSRDLDLVDQSFASSKKIKMAMEGVGFNQEGLQFVHPETNIFVEFVAPPLSVGNEPVSEIVEIKFSTGLLKTLSPTDCVKDRLAAYYHWNDQQSLAQALLVAKKQKIDSRELSRWSTKEGMKEKYRTFVEQLKV